MNIHLSIVVPVHTIPTGKRLSALVRWTLDIPEGCELILTLDADNEVKSLRRWCETNIPSAKKIVQRRNGNPGETRNLGMRLATGEWIAFVDSDDFFYPKRALNAIKTYGETSDLIVCRYETLDQNDRLIIESKKLTSLSELNVDLGFWRCLYRKSYALTVDFPSIRMGEDQVYFSRFMSLNPRIRFSNDLIYGYVGGGNQQLTKSPDAKTELKKAIYILHRELNLSEVQIDFRKQLLLRQYITLLKGAVLVDKVRYFARLMCSVVRPSYCSRLVILVLLLFRSRLAGNRKRKN